MAEQIQDRWAQWLLHRRYGGDYEQQRATLEEFLYPARDFVLEHAALAAGDVVLDVGTGDGLLAFRALEHVGERGTVIFCDISQDILDYCRSVAQEMGALARCRFVHASASDLRGIEDNSVDAVVTRAVLMYVADKPRAFSEFYRVLKPGGRLSLSEVINKFGHSAPPNTFYGYDLTPVLELARKVMVIYRRLQTEEADAMTNFDERDLLSFAESAGFQEMHMELHAEVTSVKPQAGYWQVLLQATPNPLAPTLEETINQALTPDEAEQFIAYLRPLVENTPRIKRLAVAYLWAVKNDKA
jgi:arsenite methyltransferase